MVVEPGCPACSGCEDCDGVQVDGRGGVGGDVEGSNGLFIQLGNFILIADINIHCGEGRDGGWEGGAGLAWMLSFMKLVSLAIQT